MNLVRLTCTALAFFAMTIFAGAEDKGSSSAREEPGKKIVGAGVTTTYSPGIRTSKLIGMEVRNNKNKVLGNIEDLVMDNQGRVRYAAMSRGGILGIGDKLFAVPFCCATIKADKEDAEEHYVHFDVNESKLENSPGFDQDNWPDVGTSTYWLAIDRHFENDVKRSQTAKQSEPAGETSES